MGNGEGVSPPQPTRGSGERRELPQRGPGLSPGRKRIWCTLELPEAGGNHFECFKCMFYTVQAQQLAQINMMKNANKKLKNVWVSKQHLNERQVLQKLRDIRKETDAS